MTQRANLTLTETPRRAETAPRRRQERVGRAAGPLSPWPRVGGLVVDAGGVTLVRGRLVGDRFEAAVAVHEPGPDIAGALRRVGARVRGPVCVSLPRSRTLARQFRVPAEDDTEIAAMLPHLLAGDLPLPVDRFSWGWSRAPLVAGYSLVTVYLARDDQLDAFIAPLVEAGLDVVGVVPEAWSWARTLAHAGGAGEPGDGPVSQAFVIQLDGAPCLLVERGGELLFDTMLPGGGHDDVDLAAASRRFAELFDEPLPPVAAGPGVARDGASAERTWSRFAAAVAAGAADPRRLLLPAGQRQAARRRLVRRTAGRLVRLAALAAVAWTALMVWDGRRSVEHLAVLRSEIAAGAAEAAVLESQWAAVCAADQAGSGRAAVLTALTSLRRQVTAPVHLEHLEYTSAHGVTLRGAAPGNEHVLAMMEKLAGDPVWKSLRVVQLRTAGDEAAGQVSFVVEGALK
jgi:hypothetical protein